MSDRAALHFRRDRSSPDPDLSPVVLGLRITVAVVLVGWALHATASVSALIVAALFLAIATGPLHRRIIRSTGQDWLGHLVAFMVMVVAVVLFAGGLFFAVERIASEFPAMSEMEVSSLGGMIPGIDGSGGEAAPAIAATAGAEATGGEEASSDAERPLLETVGGEIASRLGSFASTAALTVMQFTTAAGTGLTVVIFLALIMLIDAPNWRKRIEALADGDRAEAISEAMRVTSGQLRRFLMVRAALGVATGGLYMLWLWPFGVDHLLAWGIVAVLLSFVPNLGSVISGLLPTIYAFMTKDFGTAMIVGTGLFVIEQVVGNYIDPRVQGRQVSISPVVILTAMLVFIWIWGLPGALLSTPILIATLVGFSRIERLRPVALLLSDTHSFEDLDRVEQP